MQSKMIFKIYLFTKRLKFKLTMKITYTLRTVLEYFTEKLLQIYL